MLDETQFSEERRLIRDSSRDWVSKEPWARELYRHRKTQGERPFAVIKGPMHFTRFMLRSKRKTRGEWDLVAPAFNLAALWRAIPA